MLSWKEVSWTSMMRLPKWSFAKMCPSATGPRDARPDSAAAQELELFERVPFEPHRPLKLLPTYASCCPVLIVTEAVAL